MGRSQSTKPAKSAISALVLAMFLGGCNAMPAAGKHAPDGAKGTLVAETRQTVERFVATARDRLGFSDANRRPAMKQVADATVPARQRRRARRPTPTSLPDKVDAYTAPIQSTGPALGLHYLPTVARGDAPLLGAEDPYLLYSSVDTDVEPPTQRAAMSLQQLMDVPPGIPDIELIVGADGVVERARLVSLARRLPDMMILSGTKAWKFEPALREGRPVRYRLIVRLNRPSLD